MTQQCTITLGSIKIINLDERSGGGDELVKRKY